MAPRKEIIYPFFLECCQFCKDVFWENIFEDLAYGKPPQGTYISKNFLACSYKNKEFSYKLERKFPEVLYQDIFGLLTNKLGILSQKEKAQKKLLFYDIENSVKQSRQDWSKIRKKNFKDIMYEKYVIDMKHKYSLTLKQSKQLLSIILMCLMFKSITSKDIEYKDEKIINIKGITFTTGEIIMNRPFYESKDGNIVAKGLLCTTPELSSPSATSLSSSLSKSYVYQENGERSSVSISEQWPKYLKTLGDEYL